MSKWIVSFLVFFAVSTNAFGAVWHVDKDNTSGIGGGTSWATAFTTIQAAIDDIYADDESEGEERVKNVSAGRWHRPGQGGWPTGPGICSFWPSSWRCWPLWANEPVTNRFHELT